MYLASLPFSGNIYDIDSTSNYRIGLPLPNNDACNVSSEANMSLRLAYVSGVIAFVTSALLVVYNITDKRAENWPVVIVWATSAISFVSQILLFIIITTRVAVFFVSCSNASKINGACPATRYEAMRSKITDKEMCHFHPNTLTLREGGSDLFLDCLNTETFSSYVQEFARYDISNYYSAASLCKRNESSTLSNDLSWCHYWGCHAVCNEETYYLNLKWFILDNVLLVFVLVCYIVVMGEFYIQSGMKKE
jgi:hypothetical protein